MTTPRAVLWGTAAVAASLSCAGSPSQAQPQSAVPEPSSPVPSWVTRTPSPAGTLCAVGSVDRTFFAQDAHRLAGEAARSELARTVELNVSSWMIDVQSTSGGYVTRNDVLQVVESVSEGVVHGAEVKATWQDQDGRLMASGMTYALACIRTDISASELAEGFAEAAEQASPDEVESVRQRAEDAFEELEAEARRRAGGANESSASGVREGVEPKP